jgi:serine phosphatase RsbU (regulator of sigma subunit)
VAGRTIGDLLSATSHAVEEMERLTRQTEARSELEALLIRTIKAVRTTFSPRVMKAAVVQNLGQGLDADRCYFIAYDPDHDTAEVEVEWRRPDLPALAGTYEIPCDTINCTEFCLGGTRVIDLDEEGDMLRYSPLVVDGSLPLSMIHAPLLERGNEMSALVITNESRPRRWSSDELFVVEGVAAHVRAALESLRVRKRERTIARALLGSVLPAPPGDVPGLDLAVHYKAALPEMSIGGDFFDVFPLTDRTSALVLGDISGRGLAAAGQVAMIRNMIRYALYRGGSVARAAEEVNAVISAHRLLDDFATVFMSVYDADAGLLTYVSCGHEPALLRHVRDDVVEELPATGPIIGIDERGTYLQKQHSLASGDALVIYTDGLVEAGPNRSDMLEVAGLASLTHRRVEADSAKLLARTIFSGAEAHNRTALKDDACLLVAMVK